MLKRLIQLPQDRSFFLFGPRQTGKSTLINSLFGDRAWRIDLLRSEVFLEYSRQPELLRMRLEEKLRRGEPPCVFIDEIQRLPALLNEVHLLMERHSGVQFILTGSSSRKLKRGGGNLLAGRAVERRLFPLVREEIGAGFDVEAALRFGTLPPILGRGDDEARDILSAYVHTYLEEEIRAEGLSRNLGGFSRFLEMVASQSGDLVNFSSIARDCALPVRTVQSYFEILEDTLVGLRLAPWRRSLRKRLAVHPKFYLFDTGIVNALTRRLTAPADPVWRGRLFEHFIVLETHRHLHYARSEAAMFFWRTNHGAEVDIVLEKHGRMALAVEIKSSRQISGAQLTGLRSFHDEHPDTPRVIVCMAEHPFTLEGIQILPWQEYLQRLREWL